jgi:hypothetical protein
VARPRHAGEAGRGIFSVERPAVPALASPAAAPATVGRLHPRRNGVTVASLLAEFALKTGPGAYPHITRAAFTAGLKERVGNPDSVNQASSSLCGPSALMRSLLMDNPELYVRYATSLFETGEALLGKIKVKPGSDCRNCNPGTKISAIDWVTLASLRDSENDVLDYDDPSDQAGGITMPEDLAEWYEKVGYINVVNETNIYFSKSRREIETAALMARAGNRVCLFVEAGVVEKTAKGSSAFSIPDHWVMLNQSFGMRPHFGHTWDANGRNWGYDGDRVELEIWSWGRTISFKESDPSALRADEFSGRLYGFVSAQFSVKY